MKKYQPKHMKPDEHERTAPDYPDAAPMGMPFPDPDGEGEYVPTPGDTHVGNVAPNGAVIRNPWSDQPEILPDNEYTPDKEDLDLLIM